MLQPEKPATEGGRLASLYCLDLLDTPAEARFDRIVRLAQRLLNVPLAAISLIDADRQWLKASVGWTGSEVPRSQSLCAWTIQQSEPLVIADVLADPRFVGSEPVAGQADVRFYAGCALTTPDGFVVGTLSVMDRQPRQLSPADLAQLQDLAGWAAAELAVTHLTQVNGALTVSLEAMNEALREQAHVDPLTRLWDRHAISAIVERELARANREGRTVSLILADLDHYKAINDAHGRVTGNLILQEIAQRMRSSLRPYDAIGRYDGAMFLIVLIGANAASSAKTAERIRTCITSEPMGIYDGTLDVTISVGVAMSDGKVGVTAAALTGAAEGALAQAKRDGHDRVALVTA